MKDSYGIYTTDGETVAGTLHDDYAVNLAERLDESTASLYISTKNGVLLLGTAVNVQKKGRRPDTFIYLEKSEFLRELPPRIDLLYIHEFYGRVQKRLSNIEYEVRDLASDNEFFDERNQRMTSGLSGSETADYAVGRLLLSKEVVCVSDDLSKSVDFVVAVSEKLLSYISAGFTIVVAKRTFHDADLLVTEKYSGKVHIDLNTEITEDPKWKDIYRSIGIFARNPAVRQKISMEATRPKIEKRLVSEFKNHKNFPASKLRLFEDFLTEEKIGTSPEPAEVFSHSAYEARAKSGMKPPKEADYGKWKINDYDRENLMLEYEEHMEKKKKGRVRILAVAGIFVVILAALFVLFIIPGGFFGSGSNTSDIPHITPSATIVPDNLVITQLNSTPGNMPDGLLGFGSAYEIILTKPRNVTFGLTAEYMPEKTYYLMRYNQSEYSWVSVDSPVFISNESATVLVSEPGIYRLFTERESGE
ncbi:MAG: hypothetical protein JXQ82_03025 [Methanomicrobiaceae archaeon]|nr:hypothetical protein [Methanomicrobiaceae archaeon]